MTAPPELSAWIGRTERSTDLLQATPCAALAATLDEAQAADWPAPGTALPPLWHWLYFLPRHRQSDIGPDGHARRGGFLPPVPQPRRMWAGGQLRWASGQTLRIGQAVQRLSTIEDVSTKSGRSGTLVFVRVRHEIRAAGDGPASAQQETAPNEPALTEWHDIVYRDAPAQRQYVPPPDARAAPADSRWRRRVTPDDVLLFRYSALTFNGHRIHYDRRYVTEVEGYPGLIVHGPLIATLLLQLVREHAPGARVAAFEFRAVRPVFDLHPFSVHGEPDADGRSVQLWARDHEGWLTMQASARLDSA